MNFDDHPIAAISTPNGAGGIGIVRISGHNALVIAARVFRPKNPVDITKSAGYRVYYGHAVKEDGEILDECLCTVFRAPKSYTGEDCAEISCHGGLYITQQVLRQCINAGARAAQAGEFTLRAYLNGRVGLEQAEAVAAMISAQGESSLKAAQNALDGALGAKVTAMADTLAHMAAQVAAWVDYPDEDIDTPESEDILARLSPIGAQLLALIDGYENGRLMREGADTVICGKPNVGKSTLMNLLCGDERAIVTELAGTTRDILEETVRLGEVILRLADTAGLRESDSVVEQIGVQRARERIKKADLCLLIVDGSQPLEKEDKRLLEDCKDRRAIVIVNKEDLPQQLDINELEGYSLPVVKLCAKTSNAQNSGLERLKSTVLDVLGNANFDPNAPTLISERQLACCQKALDSINGAIFDLKLGITLDAAQISLEDALSDLLEIRGIDARDAVVDAVFSGFCVGK
ncbi:MAG: tRNA uridine-5-carboxymethylaminomethyl(34) synthesis GTPase MnmE [Oscillospiraceae bacterium]|nr:tRNA uridine-5-carboxymethylaminomethyl(34) synthesis GTPase MnmE [Oscillospiraceae bacterium]